MKTKRKILFSAVLLIFLVLWWRVAFYGEKPIHDEIEISNDSMQFEPKFECINSIAVSNEDISIANKLMNSKCIITLTLVDESGNTIAKCMSDGISVHTNGYTSIEDCDFTGLPVRLSLGHKYKVIYKAFMSDGSQLDNLSFIFYGETHSSNKFTALLFLLSAMAGLIGIWNIDSKKHRLYRYMMSWIIVACVTIFIMPVLESESETTAFANAYSQSGTWAGKQKCDADGYVYITESGIRNNGYMSYSTPVLRFWTDGLFGDINTQNLASINYKCNPSQMNVFMYPEIIAISITTLWKSSYRVVMMSGWLVNMIITATIFFVTLLLVDKHENIKSLIQVIFLMPSVIISSMSYTAYGIMLALLFLLATMILCMCENGRKKRYIIPSIVIAASMIEYVVQVVFFDSIRQGINMYLGAALNTIFVRFDDMLNEFVLYDYFDRSNICFSAYIFIILILCVKYRADREVGRINPKLVVSYKWCIAMLLSAYLLFTISHKYVMGNGKFGVFTDIMGYMFIPLLLISYKVKPDNAVIKDSNFKNDIIKTIAIIISCVVTLERYASL